MKHIKTYESFFGLFKKKDDELLQTIFDNIKDTFNYNKLKVNDKNSYVYYLEADDYLHIFRHKNALVDDYFIYLNGLDMEKTVSDSLKKKIFLYLKGKSEDKVNRDLSDTKSQIANRYKKPENKRIEEPKEISQRVASLQNKLSNQ